MDPLWLNLLSVLTVFFLIIVSPGPNFILVVNTALADSRRAGVCTALGVAVGSGIYAFAGLLGLILLINSLPHFAAAIRFLGGGYLVWLGAGMIRRAWQPPNFVESLGRSSAIPSLTPLRAFAAGLATNLTNPKAWAFYFSLFTLVIGPDVPLWAKGFLNLAMFAISFAWYGSVALVLSDRRVQPLFLRVLPVVQGLLGLLLVGMGARLLMAA